MSMITPAKLGLPIVTEPTPSLRERSEEVSIETIQSGKLNDFLSSLYRSMLDDDGIGIASPQVGRNIRICIVSDMGKNSQILVNPEITWFSKDTITMTEGCLSVPGVFGPVTRPKAIHVKALDHTGGKIKFKAKGWLSRVVQHEIDHLDGILFIDKAESLSYGESSESKL